MKRAGADQRKPGSNPYLWLALLLGTMMILLEFPRLVLAQGSEVEPNNPCFSAQNFAAVTLPFTVNGSLDTPPELPDVDFFQFTGTPGAGVRADLEGADTGKGTLLDPLLGVFDSSCTLLNYNDDSVGTNARLQLTIPADGVFILAATSYADFAFTGDGGLSGSYQLTLTSFVPAGAISGRTVDAVTGVPLPGDTFPFVYLELYRCSDSDCFAFVNAQSPDHEGQFSFANDYLGAPLTAGRYQIIAYADQYQQGQTDPFDVGEGEDRDIGDLPLTPLPIQFFSVDPCGDIAPAGGTCTYSVRVRNSATTFFTGAAWSLISGQGIGSVAGYTVSQTGKTSGGSAPQRVVLRPQQSTFLQFQFDVPGTVAEFAFLCAETFVGQDPHPIWNTVGQHFLFCVSKESGTFRVVPETKARKLFRQVKNKR